MPGADGLGSRVGDAVRLLLDTHILVWWFESSGRLTPGQDQAIAGAKNGKSMLVSDISLWEVATLVNLGRLSLTLPLRDWLEKATAGPLVERLPITPAVAAQVAALPDSFHRDPADRVIVSTALTENAILLTADARIIESGLVRTL